MEESQPRDENTPIRAFPPLDLPTTSKHISSSSFPSQQVGHTAGLTLDFTNNLEDKVLSETGGNDSRPKRTIKKPFWINDFVSK
jgi:hypothetical protein